MTRRLGVEPVGREAGSIMDEVVKKIKLCKIINKRTIQTRNARPYFFTAEHSIFGLSEAQAKFLYKKIKLTAQNQDKFTKRLHLYDIIYYV